MLLDEPAFRGLALVGLLLTVTGTVGALCFAAWAALDGLRAVAPRLPATTAPATAAFADSRSA
jgi:hypothetical protein